MEATFGADYKILALGNTLLEAVEWAGRNLEDNKLFKAGKVAVFSANGKRKLDATILCGQSLKAGTIAGVTDI